MTESSIPMFKTIAIIGGGPAGYIMAIRLAQHGFKVTLVEEKFVGGTCLNWGCIPSKALIHASHQYHQMQPEHLSTWGMAFSKPVTRHLDWSVLSAHIDANVQQLRGGIEQRLKRLKVQVLAGKARFVSPTALEVLSSTGKTSLLQADAFVIATGATTVMPPAFKNLPSPYAVTVNDVFHMSDLPKRLGIIGAGVIGLELAQAFQRLGVDVEVFDRLPQILPSYDRKMVNVLQQTLMQDGVTFHLGMDVRSATVDEACSQVVLHMAPMSEETAAESSVTVDRVLIVPGRRANTSFLDLEAAGVKVHPQSGGVMVNAQLQSNQAHIFAIGDVTHGHPQLAHVASHHALVLADTLAGKSQGLDERTQIPAVIYTQPELARVGDSLEEATLKGYQVRLTRFPFSALGRASIEEAKTGEVLLVVEASTGAILGAEVFSPYADALISQMLQAIELGATVEDLALTVHPHPSLSEAWLEVAERHLGHGIHLD
ncbi:MAG: dihydrolipoyl dehydrogenase [Vampirovibrio sp.]